MEEVKRMAHLRWRRLAQWVDAVGRAGWFNARLLVD